MIYLLAGYQWGDPVLIHSHPTAIIDENNMCIDKNGTIHVVWNEWYEHNLSQILYSYSQDGGNNWSIPYNVSQSDTSQLSDPAIASDNNGKLYVAYGWNSLAYDILMLKTFNGSTWSEPVRLDSNTYHFRNKFVVDNDSRIYHFWELLGVPYYRYIDIIDTEWSSIDSSITEFHFEDIIVDDNNNLHGTGYKYELSGDPIYTSYTSYNKLLDTWSDIEITDSVGTLTSSKGQRICVSDDGYIHMVTMEEEGSYFWKTFYQFKHITDSVWSVPEMVYESNSYFNTVNDIIADSQDEIHIFQQYLENGGNIDEFVKYDSLWSMDSYSFGEIKIGSPIFIESNDLLKLCFTNSTAADYDQLFFNKGLFVGIEDNNNLIENSILYQNYPNPFNNATIIPYELKENSGVKINIYNAKGQLVQSLVNEKQGKGSHSVMFEADKLNSGIYYYRLEIDGIVKETKKMLYLR